MTCPVCVCGYNKTINCRVRCPDETCGYEACKECTRTYILGTAQDPHCMGCRKAYDPEFVTTNLNMSWMKTTYRAHRKDLLLQREISRVPETMPYVDDIRTIRKKEREVAELTEALTAMRLQMQAVQQHRYEVQREIALLRRGGRPADKSKQFVMPCPDQGCRGFLSTAYKCGACDKYTCSRCHEVTGLSKVNPAHTCNEDSVKSAELIKKDTRPCPKCGERIFKISGCDQMWCPGCQTAFSWRTGHVDTGVVHNPHFYQWQRSGGAPPRNPGDVVCGGLRDWWRVRAELRHRVCDTASVRKELDALTSQAAEIHRSINHIAHTVISHLRREARATDPNRELRASYIMGEITQNQLSTTLVKRDTSRRKNTELLHVWELVNTVATEAFNAFADSAAELLRDGGEKATVAIGRVRGVSRLLANLVSTLEGIMGYANQRFAVVSATFNCYAPLLTNTLTESKQKAKQATLKADQSRVYPGAEGGM